jgi:hypothetical protein
MSIPLRSYTCAAFAALLALTLPAMVARPASAAPEETTITEVAPGVFFRKAQTEPVFTGCNQGFVVFRDHVLVIDANFPGQAENVIASIRERTDKPIKFAFANFAFKRRDLHVGDADHDDHVRRRIEDEYPRCADPYVEDCTNCRANDAGDVHADGVQRNRARELLAWNE